jgi:hypothetical protein
MRTFFAVSPNKFAGVHRMFDTILTVFGVLAIAVLLFAIHEFGHYTCALLLGVPKQRMQLHVLRSIPARVEFVGMSGFSDVDQLLSLSDRRLTAGMFIIASGGHIAELVAAAGFAAVGLLTGYEWVATQFVLLSAFITVSYLIVAVLSVSILDNPFGDPVELWKRSPPGTIALYAGFFVLIAGLVWVLEIPRETITQFGVIVPLLFVPMAVMAATNQ